MSASVKPSSNLLEEDENTSFDDTLISSQKRPRSLADLLDSNEESSEKTQSHDEAEISSTKDGAEKDTSPLATPENQSESEWNDEEESTSSSQRVEDSSSSPLDSKSGEEELAPFLQLPESEDSFSLFFELPLRPNFKIKREVALAPRILNEICFSLDPSIQESIKESMLIDSSAESLQDAIFSLAWRLSGVEQPEAFFALAEDDEENKSLKEFMLNLGSRVSYKPEVMASILSNDSLALVKSRQRATFLFLAVARLLARFSQDNAKFVRSTVPMPKRQIKYFGSCKTKDLVKQLCDGSRMFGAVRLLYGPFVYEYLAQQNPKFCHGQVRQILCDSAMWGALTAFDAAGECLHMCTISSDYILNTWWPYVKRMFYQKGHPLAFTFKTLIYYKAENYVCLSTEKFEETIANIPHAFFDRFHTIKSQHSEYRAFEKCKDLPRRSVRVKKQRKS